MKAIFEFNLPEDQEEFEIYRNSTRLYIAVEDFKNWLRSEIKHGEKPDKEREIYEYVRDKLIDMLE
jgi:hypothetical protein